MTSPVAPVVDPITEPPSDRPVGLTGARVEVEETRATQLSFWLVVVAAAAGLASLAWGVVQVIRLVVDEQAFSTGGLVFAVVGLVVLLLAVAGVTVIRPGQARVIEFFGRYLGSARRTGLTYVMPFALRRSVSVRVHNFETNALKVNDADGNPVEIAAIVVWQVADTAKAVYAVEDYESFVTVQAEAALRHVAAGHPYDDHSEVGTSLRGSTDVVSGELAVEVAQRVQVAGVEIVEVRVSHLAYAAEIAQAMLQRQQANAVVAARRQIVAGAVGMVELALERLEEKDLVDLDDERRAAMVSNLLVVLCGDQRATPIINTGSLYH